MNKLICKKFILEKGSNVLKILSDWRDLSQDCHPGNLILALPLKYKNLKNDFFPNIISSFWFFHGVYSVDWLKLHMEFNLV